MNLQYSFLKRLSKFTRSKLTIQAEWKRIGTIVLKINEKMVSGLTLML